MSAREAVRIALQAVLADRLRSSLTVLGVVIGVLAVVLLVAIGQGAREEITDTIAGLGSNLLFVLPGEGDLSQAPARSKFTLSDVDRLERALPGTDRVAGYVVGGEQVRSEDSGTFTSVYGVTPAYTDVVVRELARGQAVTGSDVATRRRVAVLGADVATELFPRTDPLGKTVTITGLRFRVVGLLEAVGGTAFGPDRDEQVLVPVTTAQRLFSTPRVDALFVASRSPATTGDDARVVERILGQRLSASDFEVVSQDEIIGAVGEVLRLLTLVLGAIAGISLLVGGVGVSNIMLMSVAERTREIGLRKALGATTRDLTVQFLLEAVVLTGIGGLLGLAGGVAAAAALDRWTALPAVVTGWSVALALGVSVGVGVFFGVWPARRAGRMDPVEALRHP